LSREERYKVYGIKTTVGQEKSVAQVMFNRLEEGQQDVASIFILPAIKGYVFVETRDRDVVVMLSQGIKHVKSRPLMAVSLEELKPHIIERPVIETIESGEMVELTAGPLKGLTGKVVRVDKLKKEVTIELKESAYPLPISVPANYVRPISRYV